LRARINFDAQDYEKLGDIPELKAGTRDREVRGEKNDVKQANFVLKEGEKKKDSHVPYIGGKKIENEGRTEHPEEIPPRSGEA